MKKAIFFDRDGTLIIDKHYLSKAEDIEYFDDTFSTLKKLMELGYLLFIVTNQSGIGRGYFTEDDMHKVHHKMLDDFSKHGIKIHDIAFCPHAPEDQCQCRKPLPKMLQDLCRKHNISPRLSVMVGDKTIDAECGKRAGMRGMTIHSGQKPRFKHLKSLSELLSL